MTSIPGVGCGSASEGPTFDNEACTSFRVPSRFGYRWNRLNHRLSRWGHGLVDRESSPPESDCQTDRLETAFTGGTFASGEDATDTPQLKYAYQSIDAANPRQVGAARRHVHAVIRATSTDTDDGSADGIATGQATFQRDALDLENYPRVSALIDGFEFYSDLPQSPSFPGNYDPANGYTSRGVSASVSVTESTSDTVTVAWRLRYGFGASADREPLNEALLDARIGAQLDILLVGTSDRRHHRRSIEYDLSYPLQEPFQERTLSHASADEQRLTIDGHPDLDRGFWGVSAFSFQLTPSAGCGPDRQACPAGDACTPDGLCEQTFGPAGYYIREMSIDVSLEDYSSDSGRAQFRVDGFASNSSEALTFYAMNHQFSADVTWIQAGGSPGRTSLDQSHPVGAMAIPLPPPPTTSTN